MPCVLNKLRLLAYTSTPSGNQKQGCALFLLSLSNLRYFSPSPSKDGKMRTPHKAKQSQDNVHGLS